jgi:hypothetical protein
MPSKKSRLKTAEIFTLGAEYERQAETEGQAKKRKKEIGDSIATELELRKVSTLTSSEDGTRITRVQTESVTIDGPALYGDLKPSQRRRVYRRSVAFSDLSDEAQVAVLAALKATGEAKKVKTTLDTSALAAAVQEGVIDAEVVEPHTTITPNAPYIRISHGTGD